MSRTRKAVRDIGHEDTCGLGCPLGSRPGGNMGANALWGWWVPGSSSKERSCWLSRAQEWVVGEEDVEVEAVDLLRSPQGLGFDSE